MGQIAQEQSQQTNSGGANPLNTAVFPQQAKDDTPGVGKPAAKKPLQPSEAVVAAISKLSAGGYDFDRTLILDRNSKQLTFFVGDYHTAEYRKGLAKAIDFLIQNADVRRVGLEGVWGPPRKGMLEDRYKLFERMFGKEIAAEKREGEKHLFEPFLDLLEQKVQHDGRTIEVFGLEPEKFFIHSTIAYEQATLVPQLLKRLNTVLQKNPEKFRGKSMKEATELILGRGGDMEAIALDAYLRNMVLHIEGDPELSKAVGDDPPLYNRDIYNSGESLIQFQRDMLSAERRFIFNARDLLSRDLHLQHRAKEGNTAFTMGWIHVASVALNTKDSALVMHPISRNSPMRAKQDPGISAVLRAKGVRPPAFMQEKKQPK